MLKTDLRGLPECSWLSCTSIIALGPFLFPLGTDLTCDPVIVQHHSRDCLDSTLTLIIIDIVYVLVHLPFF